MITLPKAKVEEWLAALSEEDRIRLARFVSTSGASDVTKIGLQAADFWVDAIGRAKDRGTPGQLSPQEGWLDADSAHAAEFRLALREVLSDGSGLPDTENIKGWLESLSQQMAERLGWNASYLFFPTAAAMIEIQAQGLENWLGS